MNKTIKKIVEQYAEESCEEEERLLETLGKIPAPSHQEDQRVTFCHDWLVAHGAQEVSVDSAKNVICKFNCTDHNDITVFMAHTDVVFPDLEPLSIKKEGRKLFAPGIGDDTANLVNLLMACKYLLDHHLQPKDGLMIVANSCEEGLGNLDGCKEIFRTYGKRIQKFYSFDGYMSQCCSSAVGSYRYRVTVHTAGGHSYINFGAPNAVEILCGLVEDLYQIQPPTEAVTTYNVGRIEGGTTVNTVAQKAMMLYEFRSTSQACLKKMEEAFTRTTEKHCGENREITVELLGVRPGNGLLPEQELQKFTANSAEVISTFFNGKVDYAAYSTDANVPLSVGTLANTIGTVSGAGAHTREEWVDLDSLPAGLKIALSLMLQTLGVGE